MEELGGSSDAANGEIVLQPTSKVDSNLSTSIFDLTAGVMDFETLLDLDTADQNDRNAYELSHIGQQMNPDNEWCKDILYQPDADHYHGERTSDIGPNSVSYNQFNVDAEMSFSDKIGDIAESQGQDVLQAEWQSEFCEYNRATDPCFLGSMVTVAPGGLIPDAAACNIEIAPDNLKDVGHSEITLDLVPSRLSDAQTKYLQGWLVEHLDYPYPTPEDIFCLQLDTGLPIQRIRNWFSRNRKKFITTGMLPPNNAQVMLDQQQNSKVCCFAIDDNDDSPLTLSNALANSSLTSLQQHSDGSSISASSTTNVTEVNQFDTYSHFQSISHLEMSYGDWWLSTLADSFELTGKDVLTSIPEICHHDEATSDIQPHIVTDAVSHLIAGIAANNDKSSTSSISRWKAATDGARSGRLPSLAVQPITPLTKPPTRRKRMRGSQSFSTAGNSNDAYSDRSASSAQSKRRRLAHEDVSYGSVTSRSHSVQSYSSYVSRRGRRLPPPGNSKAGPAPACPDEYDAPSFELYTGAFDSIDNQEITAKAHHKRPIIYQCTCCRKEFKQKSVWERHEAATHYHPVIWVCSPLSQWLKHQECAARPESERTYFRRDAFRQHLSGWHGVTASQLKATPIDVWMHGQALDPDSLTCRFCGAKLKDWTDRTRHVANHFEHGYTMDSWAEIAPTGVSKVKESVHFAMRRLRNHTSSFADALLDIPVLPKIRKADPLARAMVNY